VRGEWVVVATHNKQLRPTVTRRRGCRTAARLGSNNVGACELLESEGFVMVPDVLQEDQCNAIEAHLEGLSSGAAGTRNLLDATWCGSIAEALRASDPMAPLLVDLVAVQCTYFDKSPSANWLVPLHQDLSIPVRERIAHSELVGWSEKEGTWYVQPSPCVLSSLVAVRVHIDESGTENGPLRVVPGSHRMGRLLSSEQIALRNESTEVACIAPRGGVVVMKPLLLHASSRSTSPRPRRVLHYLYGPAQLPFGLRWSRAV
jgi:hypothetical protein